MADSARTLDQQLGKSDRERMDQYLTSLNEVETQLIASERWINVPLKKQDYTHLNLDATPEGDQPAEYYRNMLDLIALAFDADLAGFDGLGFVVQAYQKRAPFVIDFLADLARAIHREFHAGKKDGVMNDRVLVEIRCQGPPAWHLYVPVRIVGTTMVAVAARAIVAGSVLTANDLRVEQHDMTELPPGYLDDPAIAVGRTAARPISGGAVLSNQLLVVGEHRAHPEHFPGRARGFRAVRAQRPDLVVRQRTQCRDVRGGSPAPDRADPDDPDTQHRSRHR